MPNPVTLSEGAPEDDALPKRFVSPRFLPDVEIIKGNPFYITVASESDVRGTDENPENGVTVRFRILLELGIEDEAQIFIPMVLMVLGEERGWKAAGRHLIWVTTESDIDVLLARPDTVDKLCYPLDTGGVFSCARAGRAVLNLRRWHRGVRDWGDDVYGYRRYLINHEVGHLLGLGHFNCPSPGDPAPVMMQQSKSTKRCKKNGYPTKPELSRMRRVVGFRGKR